MHDRLPLGFADFEQLARCRRDLALAIGSENARGEAFVIGTAATGWSLDLDKPASHAFDGRGRGTSDLDIVVRSIELLMKMKNTPGAAPDRGASFLGNYLWLENDGPGGFLAACPKLAAFAVSWSAQLQRPVDLRLLLSTPGDAMELLDRMEPKPIVLLPIEAFVV